MTQSELDQLLKKESLEFLKEHKGDNPDALALKYGRSTSLPVRAVAEQLQCMKKAEAKLPELSKQINLYEKTALEQASSEFTAAYKAGLFHGESLIDLSGGMGIDDIYFSKSFSEVIYCEQNSLLTKIFALNLAALGIGNISIREGNSIEILSSYPDNYFDCIFADPARRDLNRRYIGLRECSPDVVENEELLLNKSAKVLIKASPALEIEEVRKQFQSLKEFTVISVDNECKEVLLNLERGYRTQNGVAVKAVLIDSKTHSQKTLSAGSGKDRNISPGVLSYFYEPDSAIIKARLSMSVAEEHSLLFLNNSVDYLTSGELKKGFPGRTFKVNRVLPYKVKEIKQYLKQENITSANIARRDFPDRPETIKKLLNLKDGGEHYLFFTKDIFGKPIVIFCNKA